MKTILRFIFNRNKVHVVDREIELRDFLEKMSNVKKLKIMKKISLKDVKNGLKRDEMRMVVGGGCGGSCCARAFHYGGFGTYSASTLCGMSQSSAISYASGSGGGNWCCSSCGSATWL